MSPRRAPLNPLIGGEGRPHTHPEARLVLKSFHQPPSLARPDEPLSPRERNVLGLLAKGLRSAEIADQLGIAPRTVSTHIHHLYEKLQVHSAAGAVGKLIASEEQGEPTD